MYDDELHQLAADYANMRKDEFNEAVEKSLDPPPPYIQKLYQWLWVAHYEGFKNGHIAKLKEKNTAAQPAVPDAMTSADIQEHIEYVAGWNDCRQAMMEMMK